MAIRTVTTDIATILIRIATAGITTITMACPATATKKG